MYCSCTPGVSPCYWDLTPSRGSVEHRGDLVALAKGLFRLARFQCHLGTSKKLFDEGKHFFMIFLFWDINLIYHASFVIRLIRLYLSLCKLFYDYEYEWYGTVCCGSTTQISCVSKPQSKFDHASMRKLPRILMCSIHLQWQEFRRSLSKLNVSCGLDVLSFKDKDTIFNLNNATLGFRVLTSIYGWIFGPVYLGVSRRKTVPSDPSFERTLSG